MNEQGLTIGNLTTICVQNAFNDLDKLVYQTPDDEYAKKVELCEYFESQRRKFAKLLVIIKWARKYSKLSLKAQKLTEIVEDKSFLFTNTADNLVDVYNLQNFQKFSTNFDIINSSKIFFGGNFESLPKSSLFMIQEKLDEEQIKWGEYNLKLQMFIKLIGCEAFRSFTKSMYSKGFLYCLYQNKFVLKLTLHKDIMMKNNEPDDPNMKNRNLDILTGNCFWFIDGLVLLPKEKGIFIDENTDLVDFFNCILITENELNLQHLLQFKLSQMQLDSADLENEQFSQNSDEDENAKNNNLKLKLSTSSKKKAIETIIIKRKREMKEKSRTQLDQNRLNIKQSHHFENNIFKSMIQFCIRAYTKLCFELIFHKAQELYHGQFYQTIQIKRTQKTSFRIYYWMKTPLFIMELTKKSKIINKNDQPENFILVKISRNQQKIKFSSSQNFNIQYESHDIQGSLENNIHKTLFAHSNKYLNVLKEALQKIVSLFRNQNDIQLINPTITKSSHQDLTKEEADFDSNIDGTPYLLISFLSNFIVIQIKITKYCQFQVKEWKNCFDETIQNRMRDLQYLLNSSSFYSISECIQNIKYDGIVLYFKKEIQNMSSNSFAFSYLPLSSKEAKVLQTKSGGIETTKREMIVKLSHLENTFIYCQIQKQFLPKFHLFIKKNSPSQFLKKTQPISENNLIHLFQFNSFNQLFQNLKYSLLSNGAMKTLVKFHFIEDLKNLEIKSKILDKENGFELNPRNLMKYFNYSVLKNRQIFGKCKLRIFENKTWELSTEIEENICKSVEKLKFENVFIHKNHEQKLYCVIFKFNAIESRPIKSFLNKASEIIFLSVLWGELQNVSKQSQLQICSQTLGFDYSPNLISFCPDQDKFNKPFFNVSIHISWSPHRNQYRFKCDPFFPFESHLEDDWGHIHDFSQIMQKFHNCYQNYRLIEYYLYEQNKLSNPKNANEENNPFVIVPHSSSFASLNCCGQNVFMIHFINENFIRLQTNETYFPGFKQFISNHIEQFIDQITGNYPTQKHKQNKISVTISRSHFHNVFIPLKKSIIANLIFRKIKSFCSKQSKLKISQTNIQFGSSFSKIIYNVFIQNNLEIDLTIECLDSSSFLRLNESQISIIKNYFKKNIVDDFANSTIKFFCFLNLVDVPIQILNNFIWFFGKMENQKEKDTEFSLIFSQISKTDFSVSKTEEFIHLLLSCLWKKRKFQIIIPISINLNNMKVFFNNSLIQKTNHLKKLENLLSQKTRNEIQNQNQNQNQNYLKKLIRNLENLKDEEIKILIEKN